MWTIQSNRDSDPRKRGRILCSGSNTTWCKWEYIFSFGVFWVWFGWTDSSLLLRRCTVWRSWESRRRRWILTEEPSLWVILWAAPELDRWWRCSTSSDAEAGGSSHLRHKDFISYQHVGLVSNVFGRVFSVFLSRVFLTAGRTASCPCASGLGWELLLSLNTPDHRSRPQIKTLVLCKCSKSSLRPHNISVTPSTRSRRD